MNDKSSKLIFLAVENESRPTRAKILTDEDAIIYLKQNAPGLMSTNN